ncbi:MAG TPA: alpha/beta hydrolase domain-containing protein [Solirubrobacteraceae bacterium]|nr:alpha/beta hydrolase domain-containing protein [Solirubrobacteraceae bacterium]
MLRAFRGPLAAACVVLCAALAAASPAWGAYEGVPTPAVEGPIAETGTSHVFMRSNVPLAEYGYTEEEFFISGTGSTYNTSGAVNVTGTKLTTGGPNENGTYPFKTRIVVRRPINSANFNGRVLAEWQNVTAGFDLEPQWDGDPYAMMKEGYVYVAVDAQTVGITGLKTYNKERYGSLEVGPSGDALSYDVYAAALKAIRGAGTGVRPLGNLTPLIKNVTATGASQSCTRLATYYNKVAPLQEIADDYLLTDCTSAVREDIPRKVLRVISEFEAKVQQTENEYPTNPNLRHWEAAAGSHVPYMVQAGWGPLIERDVGPAESLCTSTPILSTVEWPYAVDAGTDELIAWQEGGSPPPAAPRGEYVNSKTLAKNSLGIQLGGLRLPEVDVPVVRDSGENSAHSAPNPYPFSAFCTLLGQHQPFTETTLSSLYSDYGNYVDKVEADAQKLVSEGFLQPEGAQRIVDAAEEYPNLRPTAPATADASPNAGSFQLAWRGPVSSHPQSVVPKFVETHPQFEVQHRDGEGEWSTVASGLSSPSYTAAESQSGHYSYRARSTTVIPAQHMEPEETIVSPWSEPSSTIVVDKTPPTIEVSCPPTASVGQSGVVATVAASDESGLKTDPSGTIPIDTSTSGTKTVSATAVDSLGNEATSSCSTQVGFTQVLTGNVKGKLIVKAGQSVQLTSTAKASGGVTVKPGGALDVEGATLSGTLSSKGASLVRVCDATLSGSVKLVGGTGSVVLGDGGECAPDSFHGAVVVKSNAAGVTVVGDDFHSSLKATGNGGGTTVTDNSVAGTLTVTGNSGSVTDSPNEVEGKSKVQ